MPGLGNITFEKGYKQINKRNQAGGRHMEMRAGVLTVSDSRSAGTRVDTAGPAVAALCIAEGWTVANQAVVADEQAAIEAVLRSWADDDALSVVFTIGGTGFALRDVT